MKRSSNRLVRDIPAWTSHDPEGRTKPDTGWRFYLGTARAWCYVCRSEHRWDETCKAKA